MVWTEEDGEAAGPPHPRGRRPGCSLGLRGSVRPRPRLALAVPATPAAPWPVDTSPHGCLRCHVAAALCPCPLKRTVVTGSRAHPHNPGRARPKVLRLVTSAKTLFPNSVLSALLGTRTSLYRGHHLALRSRSQPPSQTQRLPLRDSRGTPRGSSAPRGARTFLANLRTARPARAAGPGPGRRRQFSLCVSDL